MIIHLLVSALVILILAFLLPGVQVSGILSAILTAIVLSLVNVFLRPALVALTLPINVFSLGIFTIIINALLILLVSAIVPGFKVNGILWALLFSVALSVVNVVFGVYVG